MLCGECKYTDSIQYLSEPVKVKCTITDEFHYLYDRCNCEFTRRLYDKRANVSTDGVNAIVSLGLLRDQIEANIKRVDIRRVYNALLEVSHEGVISDKLNEVIQYLEEFI